MSVYESLGVKPIINATGVFTRLGGSLMPPAVVDAMAQAAQQYVCIEDLQYRAGQAIAEMTGAEAAYIVSGAYAGVVLSIAACITREDPSKMNRLPNTAGMRNEVLMDRAQRNSYDHAVEAPGGVIVAVGNENGCEPAELEAAITERTAAIFCLPDWPGSKLTLAEAIRIGRRHDVPVVVDAAGRLDEPTCLHTYIAEGPDLIVFSGGKYIRGPQASGFICGRRDLISALAWQHLDMDFTPEVWTAPRELVDVQKMPFTPRQGIGRGFKAGKEEIVGLVTALRIFVNTDHAAQRVLWEQRVQYIVDHLADCPHVQAELLPAGTYRRGIPHARVRIDEQALGMTAYEFIWQLKQGAPPIHPIERELPQGAILINAFGLLEGDEAVIVRRIREIVGG